MYRALPPGEGSKALNRSATKTPPFNWAVTTRRGRPLRATSSCPLPELPDIPSGPATDLGARAEATEPNALVAVTRGDHDAPTPVAYPAGPTPVDSARQLTLHRPVPPHVGRCHRPAPRASTRRPSPAPPCGRVGLPRWAPDDLSQGLQPRTGVRRGRRLRGAAPCAAGPTLSGEDSQAEISAGRRPVARGRRDVPSASSGRSNRRPTRGQGYGEQRHGLPRAADGHRPRAGLGERSSAHAGDAGLPETTSLREQLAPLAPRSTGPLRAPGAVGPDAAHRRRHLPVVALPHPAVGGVPSLRMVYNDAYRPMLGRKHPRASGLRGTRSGRGLGRHRADARPGDGRGWRHLVDRPAARPRPQRLPRGVLLHLLVQPGPTRRARSPVSSAPSPRRRSGCSVSAGCARSPTMAGLIGHRPPVQVPTATAVLEGNAADHPGPGRRRPAEGTGPRWPRCWSRAAAAPGPGDPARLADLVRQAASTGEPPVTADRDAAVRTASPGTPTRRRTGGCRARAVRAASSCSASP